MDNYNLKFMICHYLGHCAGMHLAHTISQTNCSPTSSRSSVHVLSHNSLQEKPLVHIASPPSSCHIFAYDDITRAVRITSIGTVANKEGFQFLKHGIHSLDFHIADLFNHVVCPSFHTSWFHHIIRPIFKLGVSLDSNNYKTIVIGNIFFKLYAVVLHLCLSDEFKRRHLKAIGQTFFHLEYQTLNHIFTLCAIIEEACYLILKVFCCFVFERCLTKT